MINGRRFSYSVITKFLILDFSRVAIFLNTFKNSQLTGGFGYLVEVLQVRRSILK